MKDNDTTEYEIETIHLEQHNSKKIEKTIKRLVNNKDCYTLPFIENIKMVEQLYNQPTEILFDKDNIYLCQPKEKNIDNNLNDE